MKRIQFYPSNALARLLEDGAQSKGVSVSTYVTDLLNDCCGLTNNSASITELTSTVLKEVENYINSIPANTQFDLNTASATFRRIDMTCGKKPQTIRASIGRSFCAKLGKAPFTNVRKSIDASGKSVFSVNNALMYETFDCRP